MIELTIYALLSAEKRGSVTWDGENLTFISGFETRLVLEKEALPFLLFSLEKGFDVKIPATISGDSSEVWGAHNLGWGGGYSFFADEEEDAYLWGMFGAPAQQLHKLVCHAVDASNE